MAAAGRVLGLLAIVVSCVAPSSWASWQENVRPIVNVQLLGAEDVVRFHGNTTTTDHFRLMQIDGDHLLVGARNAVYNLTMPNLSENKKLEWFAMAEHARMCQLKGRDEEECQNYIRVMTVKEAGRLLLCGTHAFKPMCREYVYKDSEYQVEKQVNGQGVSPFDPTHNSTAVLVDGELFVGTATDYGGLDPLIYREPLRTEQYEAPILNAPNFVASFAHGDYVYFTFRETAVEYMNCGKTVYSRIARVCRHDRGGPHKFRYRWTSFLKARLNCSVAGDYPFYFNEIQSMAGPFESLHDGKRVDVIYATFTTPPNAISGSAVCAFRLPDVERVFDGAFKEQTDRDANWLPVASHKVPEPRPGQCVNDSQTLPDVTLNFVKSHALMDESVPSMINEPLLIRTGFHHRFTAIQVDPQVKTPSGKHYDVLFIGTDNGKVIKAVRTENNQPVVVEEMQVLAPSMAVTGLVIHRRSADAGGGGFGGGGSTSEPRLVVSSPAEIVSIKLQRCKVYTCSECVKLRDPYCAWDHRQKKCVAVGTWTPGANPLVQNVALGVHEACPPSPAGAPPATGVDAAPPSKPTKTSAGRDHHAAGGYASVSGVAEASLSNADLLPGGAGSGPSRGGKAFNAAGSDLDMDDLDSDLNLNTDDDGPRILPDESLPKYTAETLGIAVAAGSLAALFLGFGLGYCCGRKCRKNDEDNQPYPDTEYEYFEQRQNCHMRSLTHDPKLLPQEEATYAEPILMPAANKPLNLTSTMGHADGHTSPKATLRKMTNHHGHNLQPTLTNNMALFEASAPAPATPPPALPLLPPANASAAGLYSYGESFARDPYSSFRSREPYGGSIRSHASAYANHGPPPLPDDSHAFSTLRSNKHGANSMAADNYGTARSVKKVYL